MLSRWMSLCCVGLVGVLGGAGCAPGGGNGNDNTPSGNVNDNTDGNVNDNDDGDGDGLTAEQEAAVEAVTLLLNDLAAAFSGLKEMANPESYPTDSASFGTCPVVSASRDGTTWTIGLDYGDGCTNEYYGDATVSGQVTAVVDAEALTVEITFEAFSVDESTVDGTLSATLLSRPSDQLPFAIEASVDLETDNGLIVGTVTVFISSSDGEITLTDGQFTLVDNDDTAYVVSVDELVIDPQEHGNLIPEEGTASFELATGVGDLTVLVTITFTEESPSTGVVLVTVGDAEPVEYTLSWVGE